MVQREVPLVEIGLEGVIEEDECTHPIKEPWWHLFDVLGIEHLWHQCFAR